MSHSIFNKHNNSSIVSYVFQFYSSKGLVFQSPIYTNLDTLKLEAFKKLITYDDDLTMEIVRFE